MIPATRIARSVTTALLPQRERKRLSALRFNDAGHGYDLLGMSPEWVQLAMAIGRPLYDVYFRVTSHGAWQIPADGPVILAANHSGMLPVDAAMLYVDVIKHTSPPRVPRIVVDTFVPELPFISVFYSRIGTVNGSRETVRRMLDDGEIVVIFPEGTPGIGKPYRDRYHLQPFRVGHAELGIRHRAPIVPVAIVGAEEMWPQLARIRRLHPFGAPYLPVPAFPIPLPTHFHIWYGDPIPLHERYSEADADDPHQIAVASLEVESAVQALIDRGLREREGVYA